MNRWLWGACAALVACGNAAEARSATPAVERIAAAQRMLAHAPPPTVSCAWNGRRQECRSALYAAGTAEGSDAIAIVTAPFGRYATTFRSGAYTFTRRGPWKGVNTAFDVVKTITTRGKRRGRQSRTTVSVALLAWKVPIATRYGRQTIAEYRVYTPASDALRTDDVVRAGASALALEIAAQQLALRGASVHSRTIPGRRVDEVVSDAVLATLFHVEKMDHNEFRACAGRTSCVRRLMEMNLVVLAANRERAWSFTRSSAGARGPMQFMPGTWGMIRRLYPVALLPPFATGARDLGMSIRAAALLVDANLDYLDTAHRRFLREHPEAFAQYAAAAYNGNPKHAVRAIARCGAAWTSPSCGHLRRETLVYMDKVHAVWPIVATRYAATAIAQP